MPIGSIGAEALLARIDAGTPPVILDVRSRLEFAAGHVPGARHIPFWRLPGRIAEVAAPKDAEIVVYCGHGPRARLAGRTLQRHGFARIRYLEGHFSTWRARGLREEKER